MKRILYGVAAVLLAVLTFGGSEASATPASTAMPTHNQTTLSYFTCGATRPDPDGGGPYTGADMTVNHSHIIAAESTPEYDAIDCEDYLVGSTNGCIWRSYWLKNTNPDTGQPYGVFGPWPGSVHCYGFTP